MHLTSAIPLSKFHSVNKWRQYARMQVYQFLDSETRQFVKSII